MNAWTVPCAIDSRWLPVLAASSCRRESGSTSSRPTSPIATVARDDVSVSSHSPTASRPASGTCASLTVGVPATRTTGHATRVEGRIDQSASGAGHHERGSCRQIAERERTAPGLRCDVRPCWRNGRGPQGAEHSLESLDLRDPPRSDPTDTRHSRWASPCSRARSNFMPRCRFTRTDAGVSPVRSAISGPVMPSIRRSANVSR